MSKNALNGHSIKGLDKVELAATVGVYRAITHPLRMTIVNYIKKEQPIHVTKIYKQLSLEQSVTSSHLNILRKAGFVKTKRVGKKIFYSVDKKRIEQVSLATEKYINGL